MSQIPIKNIYYIFCYAWQRMDIGESLPVGLEDAADATELFSKVLIHATKSVIKRGLDREYVDQKDDLRAPKGKFIFSETVKRNLLEKKQLHCSYDELSSNVLQNKLLKTTLIKLWRTKDLDKALRDEMRQLSLKMYGVDEIRIIPSDFRRVKLHRNNAYYDFIMKLCEMINMSLLPSEDGDNYKFSSVLNDENKMGLVFESFVRNFYAIEQAEYKVKSEEILWDAIANDEDMAYLPKMKTDITLHSSDKKIIIDTKFYKEAMQKNMGVEKLRSSHLYQLHAYLSNSHATKQFRPEGVLLYPTVNAALDINLKIQGYRVRVKTIDLNQEWSLIKRDLLNITEKSESQNVAEL